jgi:hypothetical protein
MHHGIQNTFLHWHDLVRVFYALNCVLSDMIEAVPPTSILRNAENFYHTTRGHTSQHGNPNGQSSQDVNLNCNKYVLFVNITLKVT